MFPTRRSFSYALLIYMLSGINTSIAADTQHTWKVNITPYLWALNMNGSVQVGALKTHIDENTTDILRQFHGGGMLYLDARKNNLGLFANILYAVLEKNISTGPLTLHLRNNFGIFSAGASYEIYRRNFNHALSVSQLALIPYAGVRYTLNNTHLKLDLPVSTFSTANNQHWTDPILGAELRYDWNKTWQAILAGDVGGTNMHTDKSYNVQGFIGYKFSSFQDTTLYAGYRLLYQHYQKGRGISRYDWNMKLFGPVLGVRIGL